jgi:transposase
MNTNPTSDIITERVDDIPLLLTQIMQMGIPDLLDAHFPTHNNWEGLSLGWTAAIWLTHILSQADHRLNKVQEWVAKHIQTISGVTGLTIRALDFSDDRLAIILRYLNQDESWQKYEIDQGKHLIRVYDLSTDLVRLDATTASSFQEPTEGGLFQLGHSKNHRPDLAQVKIMLAGLDPLGLPLATQVVEGNEADDPLYEPIIKQVRTILNREGVLYVGDCKMAAISIRTAIKKALDYYLMPLPATIITEEILDTYLKPVWEQTQTLEPIYRCNEKGEQIQIAEGFEVTETVTGQIDGETISWEERRLVIRSIKHAEAQEKALNERLEKAKKAIADLTRPRSGYKCITTLDSFWPVVNDILKRYKVEGLLEIDAQEESIKHHRRRYRDKPARIEIEQVLKVHVQDNETAIETAKKRLGWRVYATNASAEKLSLHTAVLAYREEYIIERGFGRLKGKPLSLTPMYLQRDDHATGLIRLLTIGLRVLTLLEFVVRHQLSESESESEIAGLYAGNPKRSTKRPTAEALLGAFSHIDLVGIKGTDGISYHLTPLTALQQRILELLGFSPEIYTQLE